MRPYISFTVLLILPDKIKLMNPITAFILLFSTLALQAQKPRGKESG